jgi:hypothetical protein
VFRGPSLSRPLTALLDPRLLDLLDADPASAEAGMRALSARRARNGGYAHPLPSAHSVTRGPGTASRGNKVPRATLNSLS